MNAIPNLFRKGADIDHAQRWYEMFLGRLATARRTDRVISASVQIRRYAARCEAQQAGVFTYRWQIDAYGERQDFDSMWRVLRRMERRVHQKNWNLSTRHWKSEDFCDLIFYYAPLLYLRSRPRLGCKLMETALKMASRRKSWSFDVLWHVYKPFAPAAIYDVTLAHFYSALGRSLTEWPLWQRFVNGFDAKLFRLSGVPQPALKKDPALLEPFYGWITERRRDRLFSGATEGERDLTEPAGKVRKRQAAWKRRMLVVDEDPRREEVEQTLRRLFPELSTLPPRPSLKHLLESRRK